MNIETYKIYEVSELINNGYKIARLANNREFNEKAVNDKKKSLKEKAQLQAAVIGFAENAIEQGLDVVDFETGVIIPEEEISTTLVLLEGNHRYKAYVQLQNETPKEGEEPFTGKFFVTLPLTDKLSIAEMIAEMNICTCTWKGTDYIKGAVMSKPKNVTQVLSYMVELEREGYSLPAISKYITGTDNIKKGILQKFMNGDEIPEVLKDTDDNLDGIERSKKVLSAANKFGKMLKTRSFADWVISKLVSARSLTGDEVTERLVCFFNKLTEEDVKEINSLRGKKGVQTKEDAINSKLNEHWKFYLHDLKNKA